VVGVDNYLAAFRLHDSRPRAFSLVSVLLVT